MIPSDPDPDPGPEADPAAIARRVVTRATAAGQRLATAESLTAGMVVARLVDVPGASACVSGGAACYSYEAKRRVLGVDAELLARTGAVTADVARQMAHGALDLYDATLAVSTTGVAGPGPDERGVSAGTVFLALARHGEQDVVREVHLPGDRPAVRRSTVIAALSLLAEHLPSSGPETCGSQDGIAQ
jgi:nicotinamide-nucleotide amidase